MSESWQLRQVRPEDHPRMVEIGQAEDVRYRGMTDFTLEELEDQIIAESSFDLERDQIVAEADGTVVGVGLVLSRFAFMLVDPEREDPALRAELLAWIERRQHERGQDVYRVGSFAVLTPGVDVLRHSGYTVERVYAKMVRSFALTGPPEPPQVADGYRLRGVDADADAVTLHMLHERAFGEREDHTPQTFEDYVRGHLTFSQFEPAWSVLAETTDGTPAGTLVGWRPPDHPHGYVATLAVDPAHRRRGLGRALLLAAFGPIHAAGLPTAELHVASDNPKAFGVYTGVGMVEDERIEHYTRRP